MGLSLRDVKERISSTKKTSQITKAMYMVSSSKIRRSQKNYAKYQDFVDNIASLVATVLSKATDYVHPMLVKREIKKTAYILISSDTGLAGPYNANVFKEFERISASDTDYLVGTLGRKAFSYAKNKGLNLLNENATLVRDDVMFMDIVPLAKKFIALYLDGKIDRLVIVYNHFVNSLTTGVVTKELLPIDCVNGEVSPVEYLFEGGVEKTLNDLLPMYVNATLYGIILDAKTAEHSSRMNAMRQATDNADEVIGKLQLSYNRARQSAITTELIDIIAGAGAVK